MVYRSSNLFLWGSVSFLILASACAPSSKSEDSKANSSNAENLSGTALENSATPVPPLMPVATRVPVATSLPAGTSIPIPTVSPVSTPMAGETPSSVLNFSPIPLPTSTPIAVATPSPTPSLAPTSTPRSTPTSTPTPTPTPTPIPTPQSKLRVYSPPAREFLDQFGRCEAREDSYWRIVLKPWPAEHWIAEGLSPAEAENKRIAAVSKLENYPLELVHQNSEVPFLAARIPLSEDLEGMASEIFESNDFEWIRRDCLQKPSAVPNDTNYASQTYLTQISAPTAWDTTTGSSSIVIAILDVGVDSAHEDLTNLVGGYNTITCDGSESPGCGTTTPVLNVDPLDFCEHHGTSVAGLAAAVGNNAKGLAGIGWNFSIMPIRVTDNINCTALSSEIAEGIVIAAKNGAKVINASWSGVYNPIFQDAAERARRYGSITVFASGNDSSDNNTLCLGALSSSVCNEITHPDVLVVGSVDSSDAHSSFSNTGAILDMVAPGENLPILRIGSTYSTGSGTSFAAPLVAGAAALIWSVNPNLTPDEVSQILTETADDLGSAGWDTNFGYGRLNLSAAISRVGATTSIFNQSDNRKLDFLIPKGPTLIGTSEYPSLAGAFSRLFLFTYANPGAISFEERDIGLRDLWLSELPENIALGPNSIFYRKDDLSDDFVFTNQNRTAVYYGKLVNGHPYVNAKSCGPFLGISDIHLTETSGVTHSLVVADKTAGKIYAFDLTPTASSLCDNEVSVDIESPFWLRSLSAANPRIYVGFKDSGALKVRALQNSDLTTISTSNALNSYIRAAFGSPWVDATNNDLWVPVQQDDDVSPSDTIRPFDSSFNAGTSIATCRSPDQIAQDFEGNSRYRYVLCKSSKWIEIFDTSNQFVKRLSAGNSPRKIMVASDGTNRYIGVLQNDASFLVHKAAVASTTFTTTSVSLPSAMNDLGYFGSFARAALVSHANNLISIVDLSSAAIVDTFYLPRSIDSLSAQSSRVSHFVSSSTDSAYSLEELSNGLWKLRQFTVGTHPSQIAYRSNDRLYVANRDSNNLSVVNLSSRAVANIATQAGPTAFDWNATQNRLWTINEDANSFTTINITTGAEAAVTSTSLSFSPKRVRFHSSLDRIFIAGNSDAVAVNWATLTTTNTQSFSGALSDMALTTAGALLTSKISAKYYVMNATTMSTTSLNSSPDFLASNDSVAIMGLRNIPALVSSSGFTKSSLDFNRLFSNSSYFFSYEPLQKALRIYPYSWITSTTFPNSSLRVDLDPQLSSSDSAGNIWLADSSRLKIQRVTPNLQIEAMKNLSLNHPIDMASYDAKDRLYVIMDYLNAVAVVNAATPSVRYYAICQTPRQVLLDSTNAKVFVLCSDSDAIGVLNLDTNGDVSSVGFLGAQKRPIAMALNSTTSRLYVANYSSDSVSIFNTANNALVTTVSVSTRPTALAIHPTTSAVSVFHENSPNRIDIATGTNATSTTDIDDWGFTFATSVAGLSRVFALGFNRGSTYYTDANIAITSSSISLPATAKPFRISGGSAPAKVYITYPEENKIRTLTSAGALVDIAVGAHPYSTYPIDSLTRLYVSNYEDDSISIFNSSSNASITTVSLTSGCGPTALNSMTVGGVLYLYAVCSNNDSIELINTGTNVAGTPISLRIP